MTLLSKLTIVVPTYNRPQFAARNMLYWSGTEVNVFVLDGSAHSVPNQILKSLESNIHYMHMPQSSIFDRILRVVAEIRTTYVALLGDDEFFLPDGLCRCINTLDNDSHLIACMGRTLGFAVNANKITGFRPYDGMINHQIDMDDAVSRLNYHLGNYNCSMIYAVCRTAVWVQAFTIACTQVYPVYAIAELQFESAMAFFGKSCVINHLTWLRSGENPGIDDFGGLPFPEFWTAKKYEEQRYKFSEQLAVSLAHYRGVDARSLREDIIRAFNIYVKCFSDKCGHSRAGIYKEKLKKILPPQIQDLLRSIRDKALPRSRNGNLLKEFRSVAAELAYEGVKFDHQELEGTLSIVEKFHRIDRTT